MISGTESLNDILAALQRKGPSPAPAAKPAAAAAAAPKATGGNAKTAPVYSALEAQVQVLITTFLIVPLCREIVVLCQLVALTCHIRLAVLSS